jgi:hypothetical protein
MAIGVFDKSDVAAINEAANTLGGILKDRWYRKQMEDYTQNELAAYTTQSASLQAQLAQEENPDKMAQLFNSWGKMTSDFLTASSGAKYAGNPYIAATAQNIFNATNTGLTDYLGVERQFEQRSAEGKAQREEDRGLARRETEAGIAGTEATAEMQREHGLLYKAQRERPQDFKAAGGKMPSRFTGPPGSHPAQWRAYMYSPENTDERLKQFQQLRREMAKALLEQKRGTPRGGVFGKWGDTPDDLETLANEIPEEVIAKEWEKRTITNESLATGTDPRLALGFFGDRYEEKTPYEKFTPLTGDLTDDQLLSNLWGPEATSGIKMMTGESTASIDNIIKRLPDTIGQLGNGPLQGTFIETLSDGGTIQTKDGPVQVESYAQLVKLLTAKGNWMIDHHVGGRGKKDAELKPGTKAARLRAKKLHAAMVTKYAPQIALGLEIEPPNESSSILSLFRESTPVKLINRGIKEFGEIFDDDDEITIE